MVTVSLQSPANLPTALNQLSGVSTFCYPIAVTSGGIIKCTIPQHRTKLKKSALGVTGVI